MEYQICTGNHEHFGVSKKKDIISFSSQAGEKACCNLLLYPKDGGEVQRIPMEQDRSCRTKYTVGIRGLDWKNYDYNFEIDGTEKTDLYARRIAGREQWADPARRPFEAKAEGFVPQKIQKQRELLLKKIEKDNKRKIKSSFYFSNFNWKNDVYPEIKKEDMVIYKLHARGFTMGMKTQNPIRGTFEMVERKLDYLKELGITSLMFLPVYEFEEFLLLDQSKKEEQPRNLVNYWGYTCGSYFAPKASYLGREGSPDRLKHLVRKMHEKDLECLLEFYFDEKINPHLIIDVLRYWRREYHVDGFRIISSYPIANLLARDGELSGCKLFYDGFPKDEADGEERIGPELFSYNSSFLYELRKMLNHQGGSIYEFTCQMRRQQEHQGFVNFAAENNGFTLADVFSYDGKHNEKNQEENRDGTDWNYSSNCGQEGASRKKEVLGIRRRKIRNALAATAFAQGVPLIWMGDECANTQDGNNNAYCQDNETGWKDWRLQKWNKDMTGYLKEILAVRKRYPVLRNPNPFQLCDYEKRGCPDLSYHSDGGWKVDFDMNREFVGMFYWGEYMNECPDGIESIYAAYNFQNVPQKFALPEGMEWTIVVDTALEEPVPKIPVTLGNRKEFEAEACSVCLLSGKKPGWKRKEQPKEQPEE